MPSLRYQSNSPQFHPRCDAAMNLDHEALTLLDLPDPEECDFLQTLANVALSREATAAADQIRATVPSQDPIEIAASLSARLIDYLAVRAILNNTPDDTHVYDPDLF